MKTELHKISTTSLCAITALAFSAGAIAAGWAVGEFSTAGNAADWIAALGGGVAAVGTWAIGIGANNYAREAHLQRTAEISRMEREALEQKEKTFDSMILRVHRAKLLEKLYLDIEADEHASKLGAQDATGILAILKGALGSLTWPPEDLRLLRGETQVTIISIENSLSGIAQIIELALRAENAGDWTLYFQRHESIRQLCADISGYCDSAQTALVKERDAASPPI